MTDLTIRNVTKRYGALTVIPQLSFRIEDGEFVVLVGPSGCGKSTLLRMLAGLEEISGGELLMGKEVINDRPAKERDMAIVFQNYALYPHMTVAENMGFALKLRKRPRAEIDERVDKAAAILGLGSLLDRYPRALSGGQRQRVAMGRAIVRDPQVFLFDEPLSNLDAKLRVQMRAEIKALHQRLKITTVYVTHDQIEAMTMADKIVVMNEGRVEQMGTPLELYDRPADIFVAGFIGSPSMNFLPATVSASSGPVLNTPEGVNLPIEGMGLNGRSEVTYGIRPEHLELGETGIPAEVVVVEPTGSETQLYVTVGGRDVNVVLRDRVDVRPGEKVWLAPRKGCAHLFDPKSGMRITG
ncbi:MULTISPECIES: ABC transporter ATP-binding protein [Rhizobium]|uniref:Fused maltose transport subunit, ATP-binding component of ABC superfamily regulatory protein n=2 Tax=Rhizobium TaxID=379 RepID=K0Q5Q0_9HYPH|nr:MULTISPECIES: sn-glycerol-3-phosphate ABC transporter ATP-binding protein UgpC [Rhizobium]KWV53023.1 sugar ABC transporter ATP-binding protein [Rhizobium altiplani]MDQ0562357.1 multiple sugar transport system ATP-binding protein [Rhizobium mesoamericanum]CCM80207.1 fused maltose transport subunit, ATP-binding component of ABC superfamily; regulatory protein [Rhizobium mesoamericanum STM3625]